MLRKHNIIYIILTCLCLFFINFNNVSFAVEDMDKNAVVLGETPEKLVSGKINFDEISKKAKDHSYDLKIADFEVLISKQAIRNARSEYFPKINAMASTEYTKNFNDIRNSVVTTVGDAFINPYTRFQSLFGVTLSYNLLDFGVRRKNLDIAKSDVKLKELLSKEKFQELDLTLIDTYSRLLMTKKQIELNKQILELSQNNLEMTQRLFEAKEVSQTQLDDSVVAVQLSEQKIAELTALANESLNWLAFYTGEKYDLDNIIVADLKKPNFDPMTYTDYTQSIVWKIQEYEIKKKELELSIAKKAYLPKVNLYSRYYIYGSDHSSYRDALKDVSPSNYTVGGSVFMPVFDGFKTSSEVQKADLGLKQQLVTRDKAIAELLNKISIMRSNLFYMQAQTETFANAVEALKSKENSIKRLNDQKEASKLELNNAKIEVLKQQIEYEKTAINSVALLKAIQTLTTY